MKESLSWIGQPSVSLTSPWPPPTASGRGPRRGARRGGRRTPPAAPPLPLPAARWRRRLLPHSRGPAVAGGRGRGHAGAGAKQSAKQKHVLQEGPGCPSASGTFFRLGGNTKLRLINREKYSKEEARAKRSRELQRPSLGRRARSESTASRPVAQAPTRLEAKRGGSVGVQLGHTLLQGLDPHDKVAVDVVDLDLHEGLNSRR